MNNYGMICVGSMRSGASSSSQRASRRRRHERVALKAEASVQNLVDVTVNTVETNEYEVDIRPKPPKMPGKKKRAAGRDPIRDCTSFSSPVRPSCSYKARKIQISCVHFKLTITTTDPRRLY